MEIQTIKKDIEEFREHMLDIGKECFEEIGKNDMVLTKEWAKSQKKNPNLIFTLILVNPPKRDIILKFALAGFWMAECTPDEKEHEI